MTTHTDNFTETYIESKDSTVQHTQRYPESFLKIILLGFSLIGIPLIVALIDSAVTIDRLANQSRDTVYQATQMTRGSRILIDEILVMERSVKQAFILRDLSLLENYFHAHSSFVSTAKDLIERSLHIKQRLSLENILSLENEVFLKVEGIQEITESLRNLANDFSSLLELIKESSVMGNELIDQEVDKMLAMAGKARADVEIQLLALIPFVILLALAFSILLTRPIRQIDEAIYNMGQGEFSKPIRIKGPQNLKHIGNRLDWMRQRLLKSEEQKSQFLRHVSHELKTPLTAIREGADLLAEGVTGKLTAKQQLIADILHSSSLQLQKRIEDLLQFSAIHANQTTLVKRQASLKRILNEVIQNQNLTILRKCLRINMNCPVLMFECDVEKVQIILDNLLSNAVKFSPPNGKIDIIVTHENGKIIFDISDAGVGVHETDKEKIFEPFYQGQFIPDSHVQGTGLGLSIAREFALAHGGNVALIQQKDLGAHFRLTLPISDNERTL